MNITPLHPTTSARYEPARSRKQPPHLQKVTDEVILSKRAQAMLDEMRSRPDVEERLSAGLDAQALSDQRSYEVAGRIARGYYTQPSVLYHVASQLGGALTYGPA